MKFEEERFRLTIPADAALAFAMGWSDLGYLDAEDATRQVMGALAIDSLEYSEQWRAAAEAKACLAKRWPREFAA